MRARRALIAAAATLAFAGVLTMAGPVPGGRTGLVVHEWGTFSTFSGSDGAPLEFYPDGGPDLPAFVYSSVRNSKVNYEGTVSLETPVIYFYTDRPVTAAVRAEFPAGVFTEWFPQAGRPADKVLTWNDVRIRPAEPGTPLTANGPLRYYAAREVDAEPLTVVRNDARGERENERFLFYRGVGKPQTPLAVIARGNGGFSLRVNGDTPLADALLIEVKAKQMRFRQLHSLASSAATSVGPPSEWTTADPVRAALLTILVKAGLFEKEARAMIKTWEADWFGDDGTRVLYLLPKTWTDRSLPLKVTPTPETLVRVMVGRSDVLTPERELEIDAWVRQLGGPERDREAAATALAKFGRFEWPAREQAEQRLARHR